MAIIVTGSVSGNIVYAAVNNSDAADIQPKYDGHSINRITYQFTVQVGAADNVTVTVVPEILAESVSYDDADTSLDAANVQAAIEKLKQNADDAVAGDIGVTDTDSYFGSQYSDLQTVITAIIAKLKTLESSDNQTATSIASLQSSIADLKADITNAQSSIADLKADITNAQSSIADLKADITNAQSSMGTYTTKATTLKVYQNLIHALTSLANTLVTCLNPAPGKGGSNIYKDTFGFVIALDNGTPDDMDDVPEYSYHVIYTKNALPTRPDTLVDLSAIEQNCIQIDNLATMNANSNRKVVSTSLDNLNEGDQITYRAYMTHAVHGYNINFDSFPFRVGNAFRYKVASSDGDWYLTLIVAGIGTEMPPTSPPFTSFGGPITFLVFNNYKDTIGAMLTDKTSTLPEDTNWDPNATYPVDKFYSTEYYYELQHYIEPNTVKALDAMLGEGTYHMQGFSGISASYPCGVIDIRPSGKYSGKVRPLMLEDIFGSQVTYTSFNSWTPSSGTGEKLTAHVPSGFGLVKNQLPIFQMDYYSLLRRQVTDLFKEDSLVGTPRYKPTGSATIASALNQCWVGNSYIATENPGDDPFINFFSVALGSISSQYPNMMPNDPNQYMWSGRSVGGMNVLSARQRKSLSTAGTSLTKSDWGRYVGVCSVVPK